MASGDLLVHGTVYNISSGAVKWLGPHPRLQEIVQAEMPMHVWNTTPYVRSEAAAPSAEVQKIITRFKEGNERFLNGETMLADTPPSAIDPFAIVLAGAEKHTAVEKIFDVLRTPPPPLLLLHPLPAVRLRAFLAALPPSLYA